jgi:hypothetical protein
MHSQRISVGSNFCRGNDDFEQHPLPKLHIADADHGRRWTDCGNAWIVIAAAKVKALPPL